MIEEYEKQKRKRMSFMKSLLDYAMGFILIIAGVFFLFRNRFSTEINERYPPGNIDKWFGVMCMIYGSWRVYRGYKKKYFR